MILGQLDLAIELLEHYQAARVAQSAEGRQAEPLVSNHPSEDTTVHEIRKAIKRLRALLALMRGELGPKRYARENAALRDCARRLAGARDAEVMLDTLDALKKRHHSRLARSAAVGALRAQLLAEREAAAALAIRDPHVRSEVIGELHTVRARVERWGLHERPTKLLAPGLERIYRRGRRASGSPSGADNETGARGPRGAPKRCTNGASGSRSSATPRRPSTAAASPSSPPAASRDAQTGWGNCWARSTTSRCWRAGCASVPVNSPASARRASGS